MRKNICKTNRAGQQLQTLGGFWDLSEVEDRNWCTLVWTCDSQHVSKCEIQSSKSSLSNVKARVPLGPASWRISRSDRTDGCATAAKFSRLAADLVQWCDWWYASVWKRPQGTFRTPLLWEVLSFSILHKEINEWLQLNWEKSQNEPYHISLVSFLYITTNSFWVIFFFLGFVDFETWQQHGSALISIVALQNKVTGLVPSPGPLCL